MQLAQVNTEAQEKKKEGEQMKGTKKRKKNIADKTKNSSPPPLKQREAPRCRCSSPLAMMRQLSCNRLERDRIIPPNPD